MGELPPVPGVLQDHGPLHGPEGRPDADQAAGGPFRRETGEFLLHPPSLSDLKVLQQLLRLSLYLPTWRSLTSLLPLHTNLLLAC